MILFIFLLLYSLFLPLFIANSNLLKLVLCKKIMMTNNRDIKWTN
jgi:hypothetical protein